MSDPNFTDDILGVKDILDGTDPDNPITLPRRKAVIIQGAAVVTDDPAALDGAGATRVQLGIELPELTAAAPVNVTKATAAVGVADTAARADHKHDVSTAAASAITDSTNSEGAAATLARSDHGHSHGARGGGTLHAEATATAAGFVPDPTGIVAGAVLTAGTGAAGKPSWVLAASNILWLGEGLDGNVTVSAPLTLTAHMQYNNLTVVAGAVINPDGYTIRVLNTLDLTNAPAGWLVTAVANGGNGGAGTTTVAGAAGAAPATLSSRGEGGRAGTGNAGQIGNALASAAAPQAPPGAVAHTQLPTNGTGAVHSGSNPAAGGNTDGAGGTGGAGGQYGTGSAGLGALAYRFYYTPGLRSLGIIVAGGSASAADTGQTNASRLWGGQSGRGGGCGGTSTGINTPSGGGGGGGRGGDTVFISARTIARGASTAAAGIVAAGGNGGTGGAGGPGDPGTSHGNGGSGGGQGGCGGLVVIAYETLTGTTATNLISAPGGNGGTGGGGGAAHSSGTAKPGPGGGGGASGSGGVVALINRTALSVSYTYGSAGNNGTAGTAGQNVNQGTPGTGGAGNTSPGTCVVSL